MTATDLCRGFNQPNYSLITEAQNVEQLTHTHTHTQHMCNRSSLTLQTRWKLHRQTDDKNGDESPSGDSINECTVCCSSNYGGAENFLPPPFWQRYAAIRAWKGRLWAFPQSSKLRHYLGKHTSPRVWVFRLTRVKRNLPGRTGRVITQSPLHPDLAETGVIFKYNRASVDVGACLR